MTHLYLALLLALPASARAGGGGANDPALGQVQLTPEQEAHLGIRTAPATLATTPRTLPYRGVLVPRPEGPGAAIGPSGGLGAEAEARIATAWASAKEGVQLAEADLRVAAQELERATRLAEADAASLRRQQEAQAAHDRARAAVRAAREREAIARRLLPSRDAALWVRVALYAGDMDRVNPDAMARVRPLAHPPDAAIDAAPMDGPPSADPSATTVDWFYDGTGLGGRAGQVVLVELAVHEPVECLVIPAEAVIVDPAGVSWVFVAEHAGAWVRRRVQVLAADREQARIGAGLAVDERVVTDGAAELYGRLLGMGE